MDRYRAAYSGHETSTAGRTSTQVNFKQIVKAISSQYADNISAD